MEDNEKNLDQQLDSMPEDRLRELNIKAGRDSMLGYTLQNSADILFRRAKRYIEEERGMSRHQHKYIKTRQMKLIEEELKLFDLATIGIDWNICDIDGVEGYDRIRKNAYEFVRFLQLFYDRVRDPETARKLNDFMLTLPSHNEFTEEELTIRMK